jgi:hypothetical protein
MDKALEKKLDGLTSKKRRGQKREKDLEEE